MEEGFTRQERQGGQGDFYRQVRYVHSQSDQDEIDETVGDDTGAFGAAAGLVFDAHDFLGGPRLQRGAIVIDNGKVVSVVVENTPPEGTSRIFV
jgi:peroxiredoxin